MNENIKAAWEEVEDDNEGIIALNADMHTGEIYLFFKFKSKISGKHFLDIVEEWVDQSRKIQDHLLELHGDGPTDLN